MKTLQDVLVDELKDLYSAEKQLVQALPKMIKGASSEELQTAIMEHLEATKGQVTRLDQVFKLLGEKPQAKHCKGMEGLIEEGAGILEEEEAGALRDLMLVGAAQRVEHYEVAAYGTAKAMAEKLGLDKAVELLDETLSEEFDADEKLTEVAESLYEEVESGEEAEEDEEAEGDEEAELDEEEMASASSESQPKGAKSVTQRSTKVRKAV